MAQPNLISISPISGPTLSHTWVTIVGENFANTGKIVVRFGLVSIPSEDIEFLDSTKLRLVSSIYPYLVNFFRVRVPPSAASQVNIEVSNDGVYFTKLENQNFTFFQATCKNIMECDDCFRASCIWYVKKKS